MSELRAYEEVETLYTLHPPYKQPVGTWSMAGTDIRLAAYERPRWLTRFMMSVVFEIKWKDIDEQFA